MRKYFYKFEVNSELGKAFVRLWHMCNKADKAADRFAAKVGAKTYYQVAEAFAGGVSCVEFEGGTPPRPNLWRSVGKDSDEREMWVPDVESRVGRVILKEGEPVPKDRVDRIYSKQTTKNASGQTVCQYIELYRDNIPVDKAHPTRKIPYYVRESIRIERGRMKLPVVKTESILNLLGADMANGKSVDKLQVVRDTTPTFFKYSRHIYIGCAYPCRAEGLKEIDMEEYVDLEREVRIMAKCGD